MIKIPPKKPVHAQTSNVTMETAQTKLDLDILGGNGDLCSKLCQVLFVSFAK